LTNTLPFIIFNHMVKEQAAMNHVFHALAHDARRGMLGRLAAGELTVGQLAEPLTMSLAAASKHVQVLERAGLVHRTVDGRRHVCRLEPKPLASAAAWLRFYEGFWNERLDALEGLLHSRPKKDKR
jgi:DNA-binding transcriptional ArsR family regulator